MNKHLFFTLFLAAFSCPAISSPSSAYGEIKDGISEEEALELGMTPVEEVAVKKLESTLNAQESFFNEEFNEEHDAQKAKVVIMVNKAPRNLHTDGQTMKVFLDGVFAYAFVVSTGSEKKVTTRAGKSYISTTPTGYFRPRRLYRTYYSSLWGGASMHYSVFYMPGSGIALHATTPDHYDELGKRTSGGCVRLHPEDARTVQDLILETSKLKEEIFSLNDFADPAFLYNEPVRASNGKKYVRKRYKESKWQYPILGVYRKSGKIFNETKWKSTDTLIIVKNGEKL